MAQTALSMARLGFESHQFLLHSRAKNFSAGVPSVRCSRCFISSATSLFFVGLTEFGNSFSKVSISPAAFDPNSLQRQEARAQGRRQALATVFLCSAPLLLTLMPGKVLAEDAKKEDVSKDQNILSDLLSIFDPDETTKQGKKLPKAYLKSAREVVQTLRDSFGEDSKNDAKFRRNADSAKGAIREYISNWRGVKLVSAEESYKALERALRALSEFYSKRGPTAALPEEVRVRILNDLTQADSAL